MLKIRRPLGRLIFNMGIAIPGKTVFLIETAPWLELWYQGTSDRNTWLNRSKWKKSHWCKWENSWNGVTGWVPAWKMSTWLQIIPCLIVLYRLVKVASVKPKFSLHTNYHYLYCCCHCYCSHRHRHHPHHHHHHYYYHIVVVVSRIRYIRQIFGHGSDSLSSIWSPLYSKHANAGFPWYAT